MTGPVFAQSPAGTLFMVPRGLAHYIERVVLAELGSEAGQAQGIADIAELSNQLARRGFELLAPTVRVELRESNFSFGCQRQVPVRDSPSRTAEPCFLLVSLLELHVKLANAQPPSTTPGAFGPMLQFDVRRSCGMVKAEGEGPSDRTWLARIDYPQMSSFMQVEAPAEGQDGQALSVLVRELLDAQVKSLAADEHREELVQLVEQMAGAMEP